MQSAFRTAQPSDAKPALAGTLAVLAAMAIVVTLHDLGPQAQHMGLHILAMNVVAPVLAALLARHLGFVRVRWLWIAALGQIVLLWAAHAPAVQNATMHGPLQVPCTRFCCWPPCCSGWPYSACRRRSAGTRCRRCC
jgi:hypothetical protein